LIQLDHVIERVCHFAGEARPILGQANTKVAFFEGVQSCQDLGAVECWARGFPNCRHDLSRGASDCEKLAQSFAQSRVTGCQSTKRAITTEPTQPDNTDLIGRPSGT